MFRNFSTQADQSSEGYGAICHETSKEDNLLSKNTSKGSNRKSLHRLKLEFPAQKNSNSVNNQRKILGEKTDNTNTANGEMDNLILDTSLDTSMDIEDTET